MSLAGLNIVSFESRRADLVVDLVRAQGGECFNAPSVVEIPLEENGPCLALVEDLVRDRYEALVLFTGVGVDCLIEASKTLNLEKELLAALGRVTTVSRGPKPAAVLRKWGVPAKINVGEPNTWREVAAAMTGLETKSVAVQEYGVSNPEFISALRSCGFEVTATPVYRWALPQQTRLISEAARRIVAGACDIALFLSSVQLEHLLEVAERRGLREHVLRSLKSRVVTCSIGPVMTEALAKYGIEPDFIPKHPKLAICIRQLADSAGELVEGKRRRGV
ncbi:MAG: uroporphyrinogen-III synthase [Bryobacterales bacterium]|nr:uroporphyrinogen-III synthase [Bryobacterales bacterium]